MGGEAMPATELQPKLKIVRVKHPELQLIVKAEVLCEEEKEPVIKAIRFGLPIKASKLEKYLLQLAEIYAYDVIRTQMTSLITQSAEFQKLSRASIGQPCS
jgi:hypothetical protein